MIRRPLRPPERFYRMHTPRWAMLPTSGAGAAVYGGRFNRPGIDTLYLSFDQQTAIAEYTQDEFLMPVGTLIAYSVELTNIVDLSAGYQRNAWDVAWEDWGCPWRELAIANATEPPSWNLGDAAIAGNAKGILFPSLKTGGLNLAIYTARVTAEDVLTAHDPTGALPEFHSR